MLCCCFYEFPAIGGQAVASSRCRLEKAPMAPHLFRKPHRIKTKENIETLYQTKGHLAKYPGNTSDIHFIKGI